MILKRKKFSEPVAAEDKPRELVPKKIVKKAKRSGVIQKDGDGNWRIINMNGPQGPVFWKPKYKSKEACQRVLDSYHSGAWNKK